MVNIIPTLQLQLITWQSGTIHQAIHFISHRWSERAVMRNAPSNLCLMGRDVDSGILPRSPLTDNTMLFTPINLSIMRRRQVAFPRLCLHYRSG